MIVADTSALFAILAAEAEAQLFLYRMTSAKEVLLSAATLAELGVVVSSCWPMDGMSRLDGLMGMANVRIVPVDEEASRDVVAAHLRFGRGRNHPARLNFGDCFAYALAKRHGLPLLFKGNDFSHTDLPAAIPAA